MSDHYERGPYKRYLTDDDVEIPETTLRRRRLEAAEEECPQAETHDNNEDVRHEEESLISNIDKSPSNSSTSEKSENNEPDCSSVDELLSMSSSSHTSANNKPDHSSSDDRWSNETPDIFSNESLDHDVYDALDPERNNETADEVNAESEVNDESFGSGNHSSDEDDNVDAVIENDVQNQSVNEQREVNDRTPLYDGSDISKEESELLILSFLARYNLPDIALNELLELVRCHLPANADWHLSKFQLLKKFRSEEVKVYYYCPQCENAIIDFNNANQKDCEKCEYICYASKLREARNYFLHLPLKKQISELMSNRHVYQSLRKECDESDVINGRAYRKLLEKKVISENDLTLQWNTDGVKIFISSKVALWPIQVAINELPYHLRRQYMMLTGLWCGNSKPIMKLFLKPFVDELTELHEVGMMCVMPQTAEAIPIKVHTILAPVDSVARPLLQNIKQYNGKFGCSFCLNEGERVSIGRGYTRVYCGTDITKRTICQHERDSEKADRTKTNVRGVKGSSILMMLPVFNVLLSCVPDYMHSVLLGVVKTFADIWFDSKWSGKPWSIGLTSNIVDKKLLSIKPPCDITRTPRSINDRHMWKASEWKTFLLYNSLFAIKGSMPQKYIKHWFLLVFAMHLLLRDTVSQIHIRTAKQALEKFVQNVEHLYGREFLKFNVHLLLHIPDSVRQFGSLWAQSTFPFEHYNGVLAKMFKNSQWVPEQIFKTYMRYKKVEQLCEVAFSHHNCSVRGKLLYEKLLIDKNKTMNTINYSPSLKLLGVGVHFSLSITQQVLIEELLTEPVVLDEVYSHQRFVYKKILFHTDSYERLKKRENSTIKTENEKYGTIRNILIIRTVVTNQSKCVILVNELLPTGEVLIQDISLNISSASFCTALRRTTRQICIFPESVSRKCVQVPHDRETVYAIPLVNTIEKD